MATNSQHTVPDHIKLVGLHRAEFERAKTDQSYARGMQASATLLACISVLVHNEAVIYLAMVLTLIAVGFGWFFSWRSRGSHRTAERARRVLSLLQGLDWEMSGKEMADLLASFSVSDSEGRSWQDHNYFDSVQEPGPKSLVTIIQETAFWSKHLFSLTAKRYWLYSVVSLAFLLFILLIIPSIPSQRWSVTIAQLVCVALICFVTIDLLGAAIACSQAASLLSHIDDRLSNIILSGCPQPDVIAVFGDYNAAVQAAPLIPTWLYKQHRERLARLWKKRRQTLHP